MPAEIKYQTQNPHPEQLDTKPVSKTTYKKIAHCRICGNNMLIPLINLGEQTLTGVFPKTKSENLTAGPLHLVKCTPQGDDDDVCRLVQLDYVYSNEEMYGENYGYRSGLNKSMVNHLHDITREIMTRINLKEGDFIIDIGSNDGTLLSSYPAEQKLLLAGIDPSGAKFRKYYPSHVQLIPDFFSSAVVKNKFPAKKARVITSIAMFYDLEKPLDFVKQVYELLADDGIWVFEQSYLLLMLEANAYDTICHEHAEYYSLKQIKWMMDKEGFRILDIELNGTNGGSFKITVAKKQSLHASNEDRITKLLTKEIQIGLDTPVPYRVFEKKIKAHKDELCRLIRDLKASGKTIFGYGASTKGNVMLQYCGLTQKDIPFIAEVNEDKFGCFTPSTLIPIISEKEARDMKPDYFLVLPWHFREEILTREKAFMQGGGKFIFPLPEIEIFPG